MHVGILVYAAGVLYDAAARSNDLLPLLMQQRPSSKHFTTFLALQACY